MAPAKTSPWAGLSEMTAVASTVDARSKVRAPEVVICPEGVTVKAVAAVAGSSVMFLGGSFLAGGAGSSFSFLRRL